MRMCNSARAPVGGSAPYPATEIITKLPTNPGYSSVPVVLPLRSVAFGPVLWLSPATSSGYPAVCTPSPHTVSAPRERSRSFRTPDTDRYFSYFACFYALSEDVRIVIVTTTDRYQNSCHMDSRLIDTHTAEHSVIDRTLLSADRLNPEKAPDGARLHQPRMPIGARRTPNG
ncbi:hypothetical protein EVAR_20733_1 [Eumeta japonica]|uniref:Uncharacterized protein n=1 Tax=Eumeta variegata TaxID=151549 RepID=A0A4C1V9V3_EUMVA|nr:hypothetical protein EVAR_20733_1 [Eumeta japonica]